MCQRVMEGLAAATVLILQSGLGQPIGRSAGSDERVIELMPSDLKPGDEAR